MVGQDFAVFCDEGGVEVVVAVFEVPGWDCGFCGIVAVVSRYDDDFDVVDGHC